MKYIPPKKLKVLMGLFFGAGIWGIVYSLWIHPMLYLTIFGVINLSLGAMCGYLFLTQEPRSASKSKK
ncbi:MULTISPECIES: hypothetical protein [Candidatus Nitrosotenuis]|uniref:hypothetical protein n=1 Tax=Candidatus Nitrosotenuis TaxID=1825023 RepID=UPI0005B2E20E|nr:MULTISPECIES: hypothetical protein [Nitrosotenuis]QLH09192.1 hypothetical protein DSQ19_06680 [Candidatus Nitrosotenuis sp. DW1]